MNGLVDALAVNICLSEVVVGLTEGDGAVWKTWIEDQSAHLLGG